MDQSKIVCFVVFFFVSGVYGQGLTFWDWTTRKPIQKIDLGADGVMSFEVRFLHNPKEAIGYVLCALSSNVFCFSKAENGLWKAKKAIDVASKTVVNWMMPEMPGKSSCTVLAYFAYVFRDQT